VVVTISVALGGYPEYMPGPVTIPAMASRRAGLVSLTRCIQNLLLQGIVK
jgi:hypothetical protein